MLDNPIWSSLTSAHAKFAAGDEFVKMYPPDMGPFAAVPSALALADAQLDEVMHGREFVYFAGVLPLIQSQRYRVEPHAGILQMVCQELRPPPKTAAVAIRALEGSDVGAMLDLTARVFPTYFRGRTIEMGPYAGIFDGGELVAMAGLRLAPDGYREISGVCTDPRYAGRGYAGALVRHIAERVIAGGERPMLHQELDNIRARRLYEALGFTERAQLPRCALVRR
jgi:GNAT superfamily N-acetyltransferase